MFKTCPRCKQQKNHLEFNKNKSRKDGLNGYCKICSDSYRKKDLRNRAEYQRDRRRKTRSKIIQKYGGKCICCGESEEKFLSFDHVDGGGNKHRKSVGRSMKFLRWILNNNYPKTIQLLCHNCNQAKGAWGKCPHEE